MLKIYILDDEEAACNMLAVLLRKYVTEPLQIHTQQDPLRALDEVPVLQPDLLFLDIEMPGLNGFDFLKRLSLKSASVIFTTAFDQYAIQAIRVSAVDYLMKPVDKDELLAAVQRHLINKTTGWDSEPTHLVNNLLSNLLQPDPLQMRIALPLKDGVRLVEMAKIVCLEGQNNYTLFVLENGPPVLTSRTMKEYEEILHPALFMRVHKSYMINRNHINRVSGSQFIWLSNGMKIPVSRRKKAEVLSKIGVKQT